jgi:hypothetical protein
MRVALEDLDPARDVRARVLQGRALDASGAAEECRAHLGDELLAAVLVRAEHVGVGDSLPGQPRVVAGAVGQFVEEDRVVERGRIEVLRRWRRDGVGTRAVEGLGAAVLDPGRVGHRAHDAFAFRNGLERASNGGGCLDAVALLDVEDRVVPQQRRAILLGLALGLLLLFRPSPEDDGATLAALANTPAPLCGLPIGQPIRRRERHRREQEDIDAAVVLAADQIARLSGADVPRLALRNGPLLEHFDDAGGDDFIDGHEFASGFALSRASSPKAEEARSADGRGERDGRRLARRDRCGSNRSAGERRRPPCEGARFLARRRWRP